MKEYVYRIHIKTDTVKDPFEFCKKKNILGIGWGMDRESLEKFKIENNFQNYKKLVLNYYSNRGLKTALNCYSEIEENDLIWTRDRKDNIFYLCRVIGKWEYEHKNENIENDIFSYFPVEYLKIGTVEEVPGKVINSFKARNTLQRISDNDIFEISKKIYNKKSGKKIYEVKEIKDFLNLLLAEDLEEIVSLYLQLEKNYLIYTSTNKIDTAKYEFVMTSKDGKEKCYTQIKTNDRLIPEDYVNLTENNNKVYLFTLGGYEGKDIDNVICLKKDEILDFILKNKEILPNRIKYWIDEIENNS